MNQKFEMREKDKNAVLLIMKKFILTRLKMRILETDIHDTETSNRSKHLIIQCGKINNLSMKQQQQISAKIE